MHLSFLMTRPHFSAGDPASCWSCSDTLRGINLPSSWSPILHGRWSSNSEAARWPCPYKVSVCRLLFTKERYTRHAPRNSMTRTGQNKSYDVETSNNDNTSTFQQEQHSQHRPLLQKGTW
jgi:glutaredoxin